MKVLLSFSKADVLNPFIQCIRNELARKLPQDSCGLFEVNEESQASSDDSSLLLDSTDTVIAFYTENSVGRKGRCLPFLERIVEFPACRFLPILVDPIDIFKLPAFLREIQFIDASNWRERWKKEAEFDAWTADITQGLTQAISKEATAASDLEMLRVRLGLQNRAGDVRQAFFRHTLNNSALIPRTWLSEQFDQWLTTRKGQKIFCCSAPSGWGKSTALAQFATSHRTAVLGVWTHEGLSFKASARQVILTLAYQMAERLPSYRNFLLGLKAQFGQLSIQALFQLLLSEAGTFAIDGNQQSSH